MKNYKIEHMFDNVLMIIETCILLKYNFIITTNIDFLQCTGSK